MINMRDALLRVPGIAQVDLYGGSEYGMRVWLRPDRLTALGLTPADVISAITGAVVSLMDRTNVETVIVAGNIKKWKGKLMNVNIPKLRQELEASRDYVFTAANIPPALRDPFSPQ